jgi:hydrogenase nickel incorporation protein HypA/HybF
MHELSIALGILNIVRSACETGGHGRVERVRVRVGKASGVMTEALRFSFDAAREGTVAAEAELEIEEIPVGGRCRACRADFAVEEKYVFACPKCGGSEFSVETGHELEVVDLEVQE